MEFGCIKRRGQRLKIVVFPSKTVTLWREVWSASLSHEQSFFDTRCWGCVFFQGASGFHISDSCNKGSSLPKHNPHHWLCTYGGRRGCQQDIWWASGKNTCALEKKPQSAPASTCQAGFASWAATLPPTSPPPGLRTIPRLDPQQRRKTGDNGHH